MEKTSLSLLNYDDCPLTNFPAQEDNWARMSDLTPSLIAVATQYNARWNAGDLDGANAILAANPDLIKTIFNADKWNKLRDAVIAVERFFHTEVEAFIERVQQNAIGINDNPANEAEQTSTSYSSRKVETRLLETKTAITQVHKLTLPASGWSQTAPYTQSVSLAHVSALDAPVVGISIDGTATPANVKAQNKAWGFVDRAVAENGKIVFYCYNKKPTVNFTVQVKGV